MLDVVRALNEHSMALLIQEAGKFPSDANSTPAIEVLRQFAPQINDNVLSRAARCPVLLVDLNWQVTDWWQNVRKALPASMRLNGPLPLFTGSLAVPLLQEIMMQVWNAAKSQPAAAQLGFGMAPGVVHAIADLSVQEISQVAEAHSTYLRPRWEHRAVFWQRLMSAAVADGEDAIVDVQLHCLSLLGGDIVPPPRRPI